MKLPYIKVEYREEETEAPGKMSPALIVGFGLHWAWVYLLMFNGQIILFPQVASMQSLLAVTSGAAMALTLLLYALCLKQARALFATPFAIRHNRFGAAVLMVATVVLCLVGNGLPAAAAPCFAVAGVASGVGTAVLLMSFGVSFSVCDLPTIALCTALSVPVSAIVLTGSLMVAAVVAPVGAVVCLALPFLELLCLNRCSADLVDKLEFAYLTMPVKTGTFAALVGIPSVVFGLLLGVLRTCALATLSIGYEPRLFAGALFAASLATCAALILAMLTLRKSRNFAFRMLIPLMAALLGLLATPAGADDFFRAFALLGSYFMLESCLWMMYADIAQNYRVSAFTTFGFGHGLLSMGSLAGFLLIQPGEVLGFVPGDGSALAVLALVILPLGFSVLPNGAEMRSSLARGRFCPSFAHETDIEDFMRDLPAPTDDAAAAVPAEGVGEGASEGAAEEATVSGQAVAAEALAPSAADSAAVAADPTPAPGSPSGLAVSGASAAAAAAPASGSASASDPTPIAAVNPAPRSSGPSTQQATETPAQTAGRFKRKCAAVADTFLLSRKETEVLFLLAKGRNSAAIQENLYISAGTANTHMRHIYRKLDVHSQHELIDLVESMDVD